VNFAAITLCVYFCKRIFSYRLSPETFGYPPVSCTGLLSTFHISLVLVSICLTEKSQKTSALYLVTYLPNRKMFRIKFTDLNDVRTGVAQLV
jgi:hypothetical protein